MKTYNGHKNWQHWNVSLWLNNDEALWRELVHFKNHARNRDQAATMMLEWLEKHVGNSTPDGAVYSKTSIKAAMVGL